MQVCHAALVTSKNAHGTHILTMMAYGGNWSTKHHVMTLLLAVDTCRRRLVLKTLVVKTHHLPHILV